MNEFFPKNIPKSTPQNMLIIVCKYPCNAEKLLYLYSLQTILNGIMKQIPKQAEP